MKPPKFVTNLPDLDFGGLVANWNFPNPLVANWIEKLAFTCPIRLAHTPSKGPKLDRKTNKYWQNRTEPGGRTVKTGNRDENRFFKHKELDFLLIS